MLKAVSSSPDLQQIMLDATIVRVHQHGAGAKGGSISEPSDGRAEG
ncbi:transporter [Paenibacillus tyrfis]|nr:transporter [Paenibacillus tyrfis]